MLMIAPLIVVAHMLSNPQKEIEAIYKKWDIAIIKQDQKAMNEVLDDSFSAKRKNGKPPRTKKEFIDGIAARWKTDAPKEKSFSTKIKKLETKGGLTIATVFEAIEFMPDKNGKVDKLEFTSIDGWKMFGKTWRIVSTEPGE